MPPLGPVDLSPIVAVIALVVLERLVNGVLLPGSMSTEFVEGVRDRKGGMLSLEFKPNQDLDVTLTGTFRVTRAALRLFYAQGHGVIVNNASVLGWRAQAGQAHYAAAKAGVMGLTRSAAIEAAPFGVRVNAVAPSLAMHPFLAKVTSDELLAELAQREAFGRPAEPWEIATVIAFLASDYSTYMTGEVVSVSSQHP